MDETTCQTLQDKVTTYMQQESNNLHKIEKFVVATIVFFAIVFLLGGLKRRFAKLWLMKLISSAFYMSVPILISYTLGLMGQPGNSDGSKSMFSGVYGIWAVFLLFAYSSFDNLAAFTLEEINGRSKILFQFLTQFALLVLLVYDLASQSRILSISLVFFVVCLKFVERFVALAHASGATPGIRENLRKITGFINSDDEAGAGGAGAEAYSKSMHGFNYLVGPKYATTKDGKIVDGITLEKIWGCNGRLLSSESRGGDRDGRLKDTCLSFALFWLLLGKIRGYTNLYATSSSRMKAWELVRDELLTDEERVFRVIEVELGFLHDYFYSKYMFFYLNGFYWKIISLISFPIMLWYFTLKAYDYQGFNSGYEMSLGVNPDLNPKAFEILILVLYALEVIQLFLFVTSKWYNVILLCYYSKRKPGLFRHCFGRVIGAICRVSRCTSSILCKPWRRRLRLSQYSLLESCTSFSIENKPLEAVCSVFGIPLPNPSKKEGRSVALSKELKKAVVLSLQTNGQKLSNGVSSLRRSGVEETLSWALNLKSDSETILVWHVATSVCEMSLALQEEYKPEGFEVATKLSKYCAHLLAFAPSLVSVPVLEAELICETTVKEARCLLRNPVSCCGKVEGVNKYEKLMELLSGDKEVGGEMNTTLQKGVKLGKELVSMAGDERRWKLLAEFWAELILFLAPSNSNEMAHAEKLGQGGEFITHLWALLIHAGIVDRNN